MRRLLILLFLSLPIHAALRAPVTVIRDKWGVPHIYAENQHDLFYAQGFVQAEDRMYQMEIWKRAGQGRLAEILGSSFVGRDIAARKLRYRGPMKAEYESYAPDALSILEAFTEGINGFIDSRHDDLPAEFALAGFKPEHWKPEDCVQRMAAYGLMSNAGAELRIARLVAELGAGKTTELVGPKPFAKVDPVSSIDYASLDPEMLHDFIGSDIRIEVPPDGSNNWVVSGSMTATGKPFLANDPHRTLSIPSLRYLVHLVAPGWNVIGAVEPALPGVAIGHNEEIAWGLTVFGADQQDLYVETVRDGKYKTENGWRPLRIVHEKIRVKGGAPVDATLEFTRHGPLIWKKGDRAVALRWVGSEPGTAGYLGSLALDRAHDWRGFVRALRRWKVPGENFVYADRAGHIGEQSAALTPKRSWTGLLPVDGSIGGAYEWRGFIPLEDLPRSFDPERGFIATANNLTLSKDDSRHIAHQWSSDFRVDRIVEVLGGSKHVTETEMAALQNDVTSLAARATIALLRRSGLDDDGARMLLAWDGRITEDSAAAALYESWTRELRTDYARVNAGPSLAGLAEQIIGLEGTIDGIGRMSDNDRRDLMSRALTRALAATRKLLGDDPAKWRWGTIHRARFLHGLDKRADPALFDPPPVERPGDGETVNATVWRTPFDQVHGATFREIIDLSSWDRSLAINAPGQSGRPGSPHYSDLLALWARGEYFPLAYSRQFVEANSEKNVKMAPPR